MTQIRKEQLQKFQSIYKDSFGVEISEGEALKMATSLVVLGEVCLSANLKESGQK